MNWYTYLFAPDTYKAFLQTDRKNAGVRKRQQQAAARIQPGDVLVCYLTKISRWFGLLEVVGERPYHDPQEDPFPVRLRVTPLVLLEDIEHGLPIRNPEIWGALSFTRREGPASNTWTGKLRGSLVPLDGVDGSLLDRLLRRQDRERRAYPLTDDDRRKMASLRVRRRKPTWPSRRRSRIAKRTPTTHGMEAMAPGRPIRCRRPLRGSAPIRGWTCGPRGATMNGYWPRSGAATSGSSTGSR